MTLTFTHTGPSITQQDIDQKEQELGIVLPEDYQKFILKHNGGNIYPNIFLVKSILLPHTNKFYESVVTQLLPIQDVYIDTELTPKGYLVIGECEEDLLLISYQGEKEGKIYFWDFHESAEDDEKPDESNIYWVEDSFSDFLDLLSEDSENENSLDFLFKEKDLEGLKLYFRSSLYDPLQLFDKGLSDLRRIIYTVGSVELVKILVSKGVDPLEDSANWYSAARYNHVDLLMYLLEQGGMRGRDFEGLRGAALEGSFESVQFLLSLGVDPTEHLIEGALCEDKTLLGVIKSRINEPFYFDRRESFQKIYALLEPYFKEKPYYRFEDREYRWKSLEDFWWGGIKKPGLGYERLDQQDFVLLEKQLGHPLPGLLKEVYKVSNAYSPYYPVYPIVDAEGHLKNYVRFYQLETMNQDFYDEYFLGDFDADEFDREERHWPLGVLVLNRVAEHECIGLDYRKLNEKGEPSVIYVGDYPLKNVHCDESLDEGITLYYLYHLEDSFEDFMSKLLTEGEFDYLRQNSPYYVG